MCKICKMDTCGSFCKRLLVRNAGLVPLAVVASRKLEVASRLATSKTSELDLAANIAELATSS